MLTKRDKLKLFKEGFLPSEVYTLIRATGGDSLSGNVSRQNFNFNSRPFKAMRNSRKRYVRDLKEQGWTQSEIKEKISNFYRGKRATEIFSFLKLEYQPPQRLTDFQSAVRLRVRAKISRVFGRAYGRVLHRETRPKFLPKRPLYPKRPRLVRRYR